MAVKPGIKKYVHGLSSMFLTKTFENSLFVSFTRLILINTFLET